MKKNSLKETHSQKSIADNLSGLLEINNLNSNQLANLLGIPMMTVRRLLSGETEDPRISTLKIISDYFGVSVDVLVGNNSQNLLMPSKKVASYLVPKISWDSLSTSKNIREIDFKTLTEWQSISLNEQDTISKSTFALESKPSMYPRFPNGSIFIIDPEVMPADGDIVLVKIKLNNNVRPRSSFRQLRYKVICF
jgi:transcriptional regulator with XRE-family HTH domain